MYLCYVMEQPKSLVLLGGPNVKLAFEQVFPEGPYEILFVQTGMNGHKIPDEGKFDVRTADLQLRNINWKTGPISSTESFDARLVVVNSAELPNLTDEPLDFDVVGKLDIARQKEEHQETPDNSENSQSYWKTELESFLDANYSNQDLSFRDFMRKFRFTRSYGCRLFKQHLGKPYIYKLREIRIARAEQLITETRKYMKEIAAECGFRAPNRFCEAFKRIHGVTPVEYRNRYFKKDRTGASDTGDTPR